MATLKLADVVVWTVGGLFIPVITTITVVLNRMVDVWLTIMYKLVESWVQVVEISVDWLSA